MKRLIAGLINMKQLRAFALMSIALFAFSACETENYSAKVAVDSTNASANMDLQSSRSIRFRPN